MQVSATESSEATEKECLRSLAKNGADASESVHKTMSETQLDQVFTSEDGKQFVFRSSGSSSVSAKKVVIFLNGIDRDLTEWDQVTEGLRAVHPENFYLQIDLLGQGRSSDLNAPPGNKIPFQEQVAALDSLLLRLGIHDRELVLVGHSYGGGIAARFNADHPNRVGDLILLAPYVDHLETYQGGPAMHGVRVWLESIGQGRLYRSYVDGGASLWMTLAWPMYTMVSGVRAKARDVIALTNGITGLEMSASLRQAGRARVHLITAELDIVIPSIAHRELWEVIPPGRRGLRRTLQSAREMVIEFPKGVSESLKEILSR